MKDYTICLDGCDDTTSISMSLTEEQLTFLIELSKNLNTAADYGCKPRMRIEENLIESKET